MKKSKKLLAVLTCVSLFGVLTGCELNLPSFEKEAETEVVEEIDEATKEKNEAGFNKATKIEENDSSKVKIVKKSVIKNATDGLSLKGRDGLFITVKNNGKKDVISCDIYMVGYSSNKEWVEIQPQITLSDGVIQTLEYNERINAGSEAEIAVECNSETFEKVKAIVASYTTADGDVYDNPEAENWLKAIAGEEELD